MGMTRHCDCTFTWLPRRVRHPLLLTAVEGTRDHQLIKPSRHFRRWEMSVVMVRISSLIIGS